MKTSHELLEFGVDRSNDIQRGTLTFNHTRNMYNTFLILLSTALIIETKYCLCVHLLEFVLSFCAFACHHFKYRVVMFSKISSSKQCSLCLSCYFFCKELNFMFYLLFVFIYIYWCPAPFPYIIMFISFNSNTIRATNKTRTPYLYKTTEFTIVVS